VTVGSGELLASAARLFGTVGYGNATTRELARRLGVRSASLYYHIGKKEDLLYAICVDALERIRAVVAAAVDAEPDPIERVKVLIRTHLVTALADVDEHRTMLIELKSLTARRRAKVVELRDAYEELVRRTISGTQGAGAMRTDMRAKHLTLAVLNLLNWSIFWFQPGGGLTPERLADLLADLFVDGARDRGSATRERAV
jgi:AcrR family transcriptional regulator